MASLPRTRLPTLINIVRHYERLHQSAASSKPPVPTTVHGGELICASLSKQFDISNAKRCGSQRPPSTSIVADCQYRSADAIVVLDEFPKSLFHFLVLPNDTSLLSLCDVKTPAHLQRLKAMRDIARRVAQSIQEGGRDWQAALAASTPTTSTLMQRAVEVAPPVLARLPYNFASSQLNGAASSPSSDTAFKVASCAMRSKFLIGFHSLPSLPLLHLHVISLDLMGACLSKKKHYNSFVTKFFLDVDAVIRDVETNGRVTINQDVSALELFENQPLACVWCGTRFEQCDALTRHLPSCPSNGAWYPPKK